MTDYFSFRQFLLIESMSVQQARDILSVDAFPDLKSAYKAAVKKAHPDVGGTNELMVKVNAAYEVLKKSGITGDSGIKSPSWDDIHKNITKKVKSVNNIIRKNFDVSKFEKHFESIIGQKFKAGKVTYLGDNHTGYGSPNFAGVDVSFESEDGLTVFKLHSSVYFADIMKSNNGLSDSSGASYSITTEGTGFVSGKSFKVSQSAWKAPKLNSLTVGEPEKVFPKTKILRQTKTAKNKKTTRKDFVAAITGPLKGTRYDKDVYYVKNDKNVEFLLRRSVFMRQGVWDIEFGEKVGKFGIFRQKARIEIGFIAETPELVNFFVKLKKMTEKQIIDAAISLGGQKK